MVFLQAFFYGASSNIQYTKVSEFEQACFAIIYITSLFFYLTIYF